MAVSLIWHAACLYQAETFMAALIRRKLTKEDADACKMREFSFQN